MALSPIGLGTALKTLAAVGLGAKGAQFLNDHWASLNHGQPPPQTLQNAAKILGFVWNATATGGSWIYNKAVIPAASAAAGGVDYVNSVKTLDAFQVEMPDEKKDVIPHILDTPLLKGKGLTADTQNAATLPLADSGISKGVLDKFSDALTTTQDELTAHNEQPEFRANKILDAAQASVNGLSGDERAKALEQEQEMLVALAQSPQAREDESYGLSLFMSSNALQQMITDPNFDRAAYLTQNLPKLREQYDKLKSNPPPAGSSVTAKPPETIASENRASWKKSSVEADQWLNNPPSISSEEYKKPLVVGEYNGLGLAFIRDEHDPNKITVLRVDMVNGKATINQDYEAVEYTRENVNAKQYGLNDKQYGLIAQMNGLNPASSIENDLAFNARASVFNRVEEFRKSIENGDYNSRSNIFVGATNATPRTGDPGGPANRADYANRIARSTSLGQEFDPNNNNGSFGVEPIFQAGLPYGGVTSIYHEQNGKYIIAFNGRQVKGGLFGPKAEQISTAYEVDGNYVASLLKDYKAAPTDDQAAALLAAGSLNAHSYAAFKGLPPDSVQNVSSDRINPTVPASPAPAGQGRGNYQQASMRPDLPSDSQPSAQPGTDPHIAATKQRQQGINVMWQKQGSPGGGN